MSEPQPPPLPPTEGAPLPADGAPAGDVGARPKRSRARRWLRRVVVVGALGLGLVLGALGVVLFTQAGTRFAIGQGLATYAGLIPGEIEMERVDGILGGRLVLGGVVLVDRTGHRLITIDEMVFDWRPTALLRGRAEIQTLSVSGVDVDLPDDSSPGFGDLAPASDGEPPPEPPPAPDEARVGEFSLPLAVGATIRIDGAQVRQGQSLILSGADLGVKIEGAGQRAEVTLKPTTRLSLPGIPMNIGRATFGFERDGPSVVLSDMIVETDLGAVNARRMTIDLRTFAVGAQLRFAGLAAALNSRFGVPLRTDPWIRLQAGGTLDDVDITLDAAFDDQTRVQVDLHGKARPPFDLRGAVWLVADRLATYAPGIDGRVALDARVLVQGTADALGLRADARCVDCALAGIGPVELDLHADIHQLTGDVTLTLDAAGAALRADAQLVEGQALSADLALRLPELEATTAAVRGVVEAAPTLVGAVGLDARCMGPFAALNCGFALDLADFEHAAATIGAATLEGAIALGGARPVAAAELRARTVDAGAQRFRALTARVGGPIDDLLVELDARRRNRDFISLAASVRTAPTFEARLLALDGRARGARTRLSGPAAVRLDGGRILVDDLDLSFGRGRVAVTGAVDPAGESDLSLRIDRFELATLESFVPGLGLAGRVSVDGRLQGPLTDPELSLRARSSGIRFKGLGLGALDLRAALSEGQIDAKATVTGGLVKSLTLGAKGALPGRGGARPTRINLAVERFAPTRLARMVPALARLKGVVDLRADATIGGGPAQRVRADVALDGRRLAYGRYRIGDARLEARLGSGLDASLSLDTPYADRLTLTAAAPMSVALARGFAWRKSGLHAVRLDARGIGLARIGALAGELPIKGEADLQITIDGPATAPRIALGVQGADVAYQAFTDQAVDLKARLNQSGLSAELTLGSPVLTQASVNAVVPLTLAPFGRAPVVWRKDADHAVRVDIVGLDLGDLAPLHQQEGLDGQVQLVATAEGPATAPRINARLAVERALFQGRDAGDLRLRARTGDEGIDARLGWDAPGRANLELATSVPLTIDPLGAGVSWRDSDRHALELELQGLDRAALSPFVSLPAGLEPRIDIAMLGSGHLEKFVVEAKIDGDVALPTGQQLPVEGRIALTPTRQAVDIRSRNDEVPLLLSLMTQAPLAPLRRGEAKVAEVPLKAKIHLDGVPLSPLAPLLPASVFGPKGNLTVKLDAAGRVGDPTLDGVVRLSDGQLTFVALNQRIKEFGLELVVDGRRARLERLSARSGPGRITGDGALSFVKGRLDGQLGIRLKDFPVVRPGIPRGQLDGRITTRVDGPLDDLKIAVEVRRFVARLIGANVSAPTPPAQNDAIVFADAPPVEPAPPADPNQRMALTVELKDPVTIVGGGIEMEWGGGIALERAGARTEVKGELTAGDGRFVLLGREFTLTRGRVFLPDGGTAPYLDIEAFANVGGYGVTVVVKGKPSRPVLELTSDPALPTAQVFTLVLTGTVEGGGEGGADREVAALLTAFSSPELEQAMHEKFGVDRVGIAFGETVDEPILSVGKRLSRKVYVETIYHHNAPEGENTTEARMKYRFAPNWSFDSSYGDAGKGGVELLWSRRFGGIAPPTLDELGTTMSEDAPVDADPSR